MPTPFLRRARRCVVALLGATLVLASCHGSSKQAATKPTSTTEPTTDPSGHPVSLALRLGKVDVQAVGPVRAFTAAQKGGMLALVNRYVASAITTPLLTGHSAGPLMASFAPALIGRIGPKGRDRAALSDEHQPVVTRVTKTVKPPVNLVVLEQNGGALMVGAQFSLTVQGVTDQGTLIESRAGNFIFEPDAKHHWHITGYTVVVRRNVSGTTTTTRATTTTTVAS